MSFHYNLLLVRTRPSRVNLCKLAGALVNQGEDQNFLKKILFRLRLVEAESRTL